MQFDRSNSDRPYLDNLQASLGAGKGPSQATTPAQVAPSMTPAPFVPEQAPPTLPMQTGAPMPASKGSGKGPMSLQQPLQAQAGPGNLNGADAIMQPGSNRPMDLQALISGLMSSGLLGGL